MQWESLICFPTILIFFKVLRIIYILRSVQIKHKLTDFIHTQSSGNIFRWTFGVLVGNVLLSSIFLYKTMPMAFQVKYRTTIVLYDTPTEEATRFKYLGCEVTYNFGGNGRHRPPAFQ